MAGFGAFDFSKITSMVDKTLGIDENQAEQAMEASMDEGNFLTVVAGKEATTKLAGASEKAAKQLGQVVEKVKATPLAVAGADKKQKKADTLKTKKSDDFFSNFDLEGQFKSEGTPVKSEGTPAKANDEEKTKVKPSSVKKEPPQPKMEETEKPPTSQLDSPAQDGWDDDWGTPQKVGGPAPKDKGSASKPATKLRTPLKQQSQPTAEQQSQPTAVQAADKVDTSKEATQEPETPTPKAADESKPSTSNESVPADSVVVPDEVPSSKATDTDETPAQATASTEDEKPNSANGSQHHDPESLPSQQSASASTDVPAGTGDGEESHWKKKFYDLKARSEVSAKELEQLQDALAKKGTQLFEAVSRQEELSVELEQKRVECEKFEAEAKEFATERDKMRKVKTELTSAQAAREELLAEGEKLMKKKQEQEDTIKVLRKQLKEKDQGNKTLGELREAEEAKMKGYEERLNEAHQASKLKDQKIKELASENQELKKQAEKAEKEAQSLQQKLTALERRVEALQERKESLEKQLGEASAEAHDDARRVVEKERKEYVKEAEAKVETLTDTIESMQTAMRRQESQAASKEQRLREEMEDLQRRCREAEERSQELSSAVPEATRPLLRQIESLQASFAEKQKVWEKVEAALRQRAADAEGEARQSTESERVAKERFKQYQEESGIMEARVNTLQTEVSRLNAELRGGRDELDAAAAKERDALAELEVVKATAEKRANEISELKAANRRLGTEQELQLSEEKERAAEEKLEMQRQIKSLEYQLQNLKGGALQASQTSDMGESVASPAFNVSSFQSSVLDLQGSSNDMFSDLTAQSPQRGSSFFDPTVTKQNEAKLHGLQQRVMALENERDGLADQLAYTVTMNQKASSDAAALPALQEELGYLTKQQDLTLELLGAREEELDDLRLTLEEIRLIYRAELEKLMEFVPSSSQWKAQQFPTSSRPGARHKELEPRDGEHSLPRSNSKQDL